MLTKSIITGVLLASLGGGAYYFGEEGLRSFLDERVKKLRVQKRVIPVAEKVLSIEKKTPNIVQTPDIKYTFFKSLTAPHTEKYPGMEGEVFANTTRVSSGIRRPPLPVNRLMRRYGAIQSSPDTLANAKENIQRQGEANGYMVQVSSFRELDGARALKNRLSKNGYPAFLREAVIPDKGVWYRVYLGRYPDKESALFAAESAKINERLPTVVRRTG